MTDKQRDTVRVLTDELIRVWFAIKESDPKTAKELDKAIDKLWQITER